MTLPDETILFSFRRSRNRIRGLRELGAREFATAAQLARGMGIRLAEVQDVMEGHLPTYRPDLSLVGLGLARRVGSPAGPGYAITSAGREVLRALEGRHDDAGSRTW
jgi:predicted transcriptional regulator with HTH domain